MTNELPPLPETEWVLHMPAMRWESAWTSSQEGYTAEQMQEYARAAIAQAFKANEPCWCHECNKGRTVNGIPYSATTMILCPDCGNKRCPKANDHSNKCTGSNEAGQPGSAYTTMQTAHGIKGGEQ